MRSIMAELQKSFKACLLSESVLLLVILWLSITARTSMAATRVPVGVILDLNSTLGILVNNTLHVAVDDYYSNHTDTATKIDLIVRNVSQKEVVAAAEQAFDLITKEKVRAILGPQNSEQARFIVKLGNESQVPVIWFPITGPSLLPPPSPSSIYSDDQGLKYYCYQFQAIADTIKALGWQSVIPIYEETEYGSHLIPCLSNVFKEMGIRMANVTAMDSDSTESAINSTLDSLNKTRARVFLVHMSMDLGANFILAAQRKEMMGEGYAWILTQELSSLTDPLVVINRTLYHNDGSITFFDDYVTLKRYMQGAIGVRPLDLISRKKKERKDKESNFFKKFNSVLTIYGWWAYHTLEALAIAVEKAPAGKDTGLKLASEIWATSFTGYSGIHFDLRQGQLNQSELEVYNVVGTRERSIGYWRPGSGLDQNNSKDGGGVKSGEYPLKGPLWPGDTLDKPPKLRIGVPRTTSFPEFVNVDNSSNPLFDGFAITVFLKAASVLPFPFKNYEFVPLPYESGSPMNYDDILCSQMQVEDLDAIIGDITIVANRTECVDFTLPYLDSSVSMVVKMKNASSAGILFKPFKWSLWLVLGGTFAVATTIIIILEIYKVNKENKTNKQDQTEEFRLNPFLVYKIDGMEFASKAAGWMVILTSLLFILVVQIYTASLTSILTQERSKEPSLKNENETKSSDIRVGYRNGSWVYGLLINQIGLNSNQLTALASREEYNSALFRGSKKGGVDAIFDETPYLTLFLSQYKSRFMMIGPIYKTGGLAFAFPKKSSLVSHFSNAILNVTQDAEPFRVLKARNSLPTSIEDLEFQDENDVVAKGLKIDNFGGLYPVLVTVVALGIALAILNPLVIQWLRDKLPFKSSTNPP